MFKRKKKAKSPDDTFLVISSLTRRCNHSSSQTPKASCPCRARRGAAAAGLAGPTAQSSAGDSRAPLRDCAPAEQSALHGHRSPFAQGWSHCCDGTPWLGLQEKNHCLVPKPGCRYQTTQSKTACSCWFEKTLFDNVFWMHKTIQISSWRWSFRQIFPGEDFVSSLTLYGISDQKNPQLSPSFLKCSCSSLRDTPVVRFPLSYLLQWANMFSPLNILFSYSH